TVQHCATAVVDAWIRDPVPALPRARVRTVVLRIDADEGDLVPVLSLRLLQALRLVDARHAPRSPEVEHDRFASARRRKIDAALTGRPRAVDDRRPALS